MFPYSTAILSIYVAQLVGALLAVTILFSLWRKSSNRALLYLMLGFFCLGLMAAGKATSLWQLRWESQAARDWVRFASVFVALLQPALFLAGTKELLENRGSCSKQNMRQFYPWLGVVLVGMLVLPRVPLEWRIPARVLALLGVSGVSSVLARSCFSRASGAVYGIGAKLSVAGVALYGTTQIFYGLGTLPMEPAGWMGGAWMFGFGDVFFQSLVGIGLFVWSMELDHNRGEMAERESIRLAGELHNARQAECIGFRTARIAHDFNNLMTSLVGHFHVAQMRSSPDAPTEHFELVNGIVNRAGELTRQLLGPTDADGTEVFARDLSADLARMESSLRGLVGPRIPLRIDLGDDLPSVRIGLERFEQVVLNLVLNARDACAQGGDIQIEVRTVILDKGHPNDKGLGPGTYLLMVVGDTGCGIDRANLEHLFDPFFSTKPSAQGSGFGLPTVQEYVTQAGGIVACGCEPERTRFEVYLLGASLEPAGAATDECTGKLGC